MAIQLQFLYIYSSNGHYHELFYLEITREHFKDKVWHYQCYALNVNTNAKRFSNEITIDAIGKYIARTIEYIPIYTSSLYVYT